MKKFLIFLCASITLFFCDADAQTIPTGTPQRIQHPYYQYDGFIEPKGGILLPRRIANFTPKSQALIYDTATGKISVYIGGWKTLQNVAYTADYNDLINRPDLTQYVPISRTINGYSLTSNVTINKVDIGLGNVQNVDVTNANNITTGTLGDARLSANVTLQGNTFNGANQLLQLDAGGKVAYANLPAALMIYKGVWDASSNTPTLADGTGVNGWVYRVHPGGTVNFGSGNITFNSGDYVIYNGSVWQKSGGGDAVTSVNGQQGVVVLTTANISEGGTNYYYTNTRVQTFADTRYSLLNHEHVYSDIANLSSYTGFDVRYKSISYVPAWSEITGKPSFATVATSGSYSDLTGTPSLGSLAALSSIGNTYITDLAWSKITGAPAFLTTESDPVYVASSWYATTNNASNWNTAYSWGNHASQGYVIGTGTSGTIPQWNSTTGIGNSPISISGSWIFTNNYTLVSNHTSAGNATKNLALVDGNTGAGNSTAIYMGYNANGGDPYGARIVQTGNPGSTRRGGFKFQSHGDASGDTDAFYYDLFSLTTAGDGYLLGSLVTGSDIKVNLGVSGALWSRYGVGSDNYASALSWNAIQLGNNGPNYIVAGHNVVGGDLRFYVNNTNRVINNTTPNGTLAMFLSADGDAAFYGDVGITGAVQFNVNTWNISSDGRQRLYFGNGTNTYIKGSDILFRDNADNDIARFYATTGNGYVMGSMTAASFSGAATGLTGTASSLNIGGNAATATNSTQWNGYNLSFSNGAVSSYIMSWNGTSFGLSGQTELRTFLGLNTAAYTASSAYEVPLSFSTGLNRSGNTITNTGVTSIAGTTNQIAVSASTGAVTVSLTNNVVLTGTITSSASYETSDRRLKKQLTGTKIIAPIESLEARLYEKDGRVEYGYYAQDALKILPTSVRMGSDGYYTLSYTQIFVAKISSLEKRLRDLEQLLEKGGIK